MRCWFSRHITETTFFCNRYLCPSTIWNTLLIFFFFFLMFVSQRGSLIWRESHWLWVWGECVWRSAHHPGVTPSSLSDTCLSSSDLFHDKHSSPGLWNSACSLLAGRRWKDGLVAEHLIMLAPERPMAWHKNAVILRGLSVRQLP